MTMAVDGWCNGPNNHVSNFRVAAQLVDRTPIFFRQCSGRHDIFSLLDVIRFNIGAEYRKATLRVHDAVVRV